MRELTISWGHAFGKDLLRAFGQFDLVGAAEPAASPFVCGLAFLLLVAGFLPFFLGPHRERLLDLGRSRRGGATDLLFEFFDALLGRCQLPLCRLQLSLHCHDDVEQTFDADSSLTQVFLELVDRLHANSLAN